MDSPRHSTIRQVALASLVGATMEWYDFLIYGTAAALVFPKLFFPQANALAGTLASLATFGVAFIARPIGGLTFGHFGDRFGRKSMLVCTVVLMGGSTLAVGLLPTFKDIGLLAPIGLVILRFIQGFAVGGEWGGATLMAVEHAPEEKRCFYGSWPAIGAPAGLMLSTLAFGAVTSMPTDEFFVWGWRIPFLLSAALIVLGMMIRSRVDESPAMSSVTARSKLPLREVLDGYAAVSGIAVGVVLVGISGFYIVVTFSLSYLTERFEVSKNVLLVGLVLAGLSQLVGTLTAGQLADRIGMRRIAIRSSGCILLFAYPYFMLIDTAQPALIWIAMSAWMFAGGALAGITGTMLAGFYPARLRYSGISFSYQTAGLLGGAPAPFLSTLLSHSAGGASWPVATYLAAISLISFISIGWACQRHQLGVKGENSQWIRHGRSGN